ncbi:copper resistance CopC/CopD family protein [Ammoniphilus resinae]|uniref:Copper transport protein n=1 Tax=Ammoniphilus resinae TaxID=861532 RepID=A0ABS4GP81_9BACL|nr:copper resistance protein CopC [Ammoniphilus resinae]MBP1932087.1 copper transport protein [Ammoniphilus resinae]
MNKGWRKGCGTLFLILIFLLSFAPGVFAHAVLNEATPPLNSQLSTAPKEIRYVFNERIESKLYYIRIYDDQGELVPTEEAKLSKDQKEITLQLPQMAQGIYTITYHVLSGDGHSIKQSSVLSIGTYQQPNTWYMGQISNSSHHEGISVDRIFYYISFLFLSGWVFWGMFLPFSSDQARKIYQIWLKRLLNFYLLMLITTGFLQMNSSLSGWGPGEIYELLFHSLFGWTWLGSLVLGLLGYLVLPRWKWLGALWIVLWMIAEGVSGHAITFTPELLNVVIDVVHLLAATVWVGGLFVVIIFWKKEREELVSRFLPVFSRAALVSIVLMILTGVFLASMFLPKWKYLWETTWGIFLLLKVLLVLVVLFTASLIRAKMGKGQVGDGLWTSLRVDFSAMLGILAIVGIITYVNPVPTNEPLYWHEMGNLQHVTTQITPKAPGDNQFSVSVAITKERTTVKRVEVFLKSRDQEMAPIEVPVEEVAENGAAGESQFMVKGPYLPFAGDWTIEVRILDSNDDEKVYSKDFTVY